MRCRLILFVSSIAILGLGPSSRANPGHADSRPSVSAHDLLQKVVDNELAADKNDQSLWMYKSETRKRGGDTTKEVIETKQGDIARTLKINGQPLSAEQEKKEKQRIQRLASNPSDQRKAQRAKAQDGQKAEQMLALLPKALEVSYGQRRGDLVDLTFKPNPQFHPKSHEAEVFRAMAGDIWVNTKENRLEEINGRLIERVSFGGGLLGHLDKGGQFHVTQTQAGPGHWEVAQTRIDMRGKALFFKTVSVQENETRTDFQQVPDGFTLVQAAQKLQQQNPQASAELTQGNAAAQR